MIRSLPFAGVVCAAALMLAPSSAHALTIPVVYAVNPAGNCQGALPQFAGTLRARPYGIGNEGETNAFVTCSLPHAEYPVADGNNVSEDATAVSITIANGGSSAATVNCTFVHGSGYTGGSNARAIVRSRSISANGSFEFVWTASEATLPGQLVSPNFSCALPPGFVVTRVSKSFLRNVGF